MKDKSNLSNKILSARSRIIKKNGFFGTLLLSLKMAFTDEISTAATDGKYIYFNEDFMKDLTSSEIEFIILHETMHVALNHMERSKGKNNEIYNIAADIVINSNIARMYGSVNAIKVNGNISMNTVPGVNLFENDGYLFTTEEVYNKLLKVFIRSKFIDEYSEKRFDNHSLWADANTDEIKENIIRAHMSSSNFKIQGDLPGEVETYLNELVNPRIDWRVLLNDFIQSELNDYSFTPPDNRYNEFDFFLPGFNEKEESIENIIFAVDTSGSMLDEDIISLYSEINGAIEQFSGKIKGYFMEFDYTVQSVNEINDSFDITKVKTLGRGGTSYKAITDYIKDKMSDVSINKLIILTDGYADFLTSKDLNGISVLYIFTESLKEYPEIGEYTILHRIGD